MATSMSYNATTGKVEFGSGVSLNWVGATYIDKDGVFTGTLSADTIKTISISASQITSGIIAAARIDTAALKASLITAGNIEALTLNVTKGKSAAGRWMPTPLPGYEEQHCGELHLCRR